MNTTPHSPPAPLGLNTALGACCASMFSRQEVRLARWALLARSLFDRWAEEYYRPSWPLAERIAVWAICDLNSEEDS